MRQSRVPEFPIFKRQDAELPRQAHGLSHLCVSGGWVTVVLIGNIIYRYNITNPRNIDCELMNTGSTAAYGTFTVAMEIKKEDDRVRKVFQDPTGAHVLICMKSRECFYIGQASKRAQPRLLPRVKGQVIESVAWNKVEPKEQGGTGAILLGTAQGKINTLVALNITWLLFQDPSLRLTFCLRIAS